MPGRLFGRVPVPSVHTPILCGVPAPIRVARPPQLPPPLPSPITSGFSFALCLPPFFLLFFFPPNLVSIETRLAEGEIKQPHVTQIPTLKNLLVVLAVALHNREPVRAQMGVPGWDEGHRAQPKTTRLR